MKKINTLFPQESLDSINSVADDSMNSKSEVARAAMALGLSMLVVGKNSMTDKEFYNFIIDSKVKGW